TCHTSFGFHWVLAATRCGRRTQYSRGVAGARDCLRLPARGPQRPRGCERLRMEANWLAALPVPDFLPRMCGQLHVELAHRIYTSVRPAAWHGNCSMSDPSMRGNWLVTIPMMALAACSSPNSTTGTTSMYQPDKHATGSGGTTTRDGGLAGAGA